MKALVLSLLLSLVVLSACGPSEPDLRIEGAWVRPDPLMENAAGYLVIKNEGGQADTLTGVQVQFAEMAGVHQTVMEGAIHKMEPTPRLEVPAGGQVELKPLSYHIMLMGLEEGLEFGQLVTLVLEFETSGEIAVEAEVRPIEADRGEMDDESSDHNHDMEHSEVDQ